MSISNQINELTIDELISLEVDKCYNKQEIISEVVMRLYDSVDSVELQKLWKYLGELNNIKIMALIFLLRRNKLLFLK